MGRNLIDLVSPNNANDASKIYGVGVGIVTNNQDPDGMHRVKVKLPWLSDDQESWWARVTTPMAGNGRGMYFLPEVDDEVLIAFEHGDVRFPYVVGSLWNGKDKAPASNDGGKNNTREIKSRSGHLVRLNDTDGSESVEIIDKTGSNSITLNTSDNSITIKCTGRMKLQAMGIEIASQADVKIEAQSTMDLNATAPMTIKGAMVNIN
ncbi:MAG: phage baseplate assembly protein V [Bryobacteraceae bacterium]